MKDNKLSNKQKKILIELLKNTILTINDLGFEVQLQYVHKENNDSYSFVVEDLELVDM